MASLDRRLLLWLVPALLALLVVSPVGAQSRSSFTGQSPSPLPSQLITPSNPIGAPGSAYGPAGSDFIPLSSGMLGSLLPRIPNLELGFLYNIGSNLRSGRAYLDYLVPFGLGSNSVLFGEAHGEFQDFWKRPHVSAVAAPGFTVTHSASNNRTDLSFGGGYRRVVGNSGFVGINAFYDSTKLVGRWFASGGAGLEMVALTPADGAIDLNFNWYGNLINRSELINAFRNRAGSWDIEVGVSQPLFDQALDLRLNATAYDFNIGTAVYGWRTGAELTTRNGFFTLKYEYGHDKVNGSYNTVGGYVNIGCQLENLVRGESPFMSPQPVFGSPRNLTRLLSQKVRRNWYQPASVVVSRSGSTSEPGAQKRLVLVDIQVSGVTGTFTPDVSNNSWSLEGSDCAFANVCYQVKVSDGSLTELGGIIIAPSPSGFSTQWSGTGNFTAVPTPMTASPQDLCSLSGFGHHHVELLEPQTVSGTVTIYSTDPSIEPLTITFTIHTVGFC